MSSRKLIIPTVLLAASFILACNNSAQNKEKEKPVAETASVKPADPVVTEAAPAPVTTETKCYSNEGLKYETVITVAFNGNTVSGNVMSRDLGDDKKETVKFSGTRDGNTLLVKFEGQPPVVGAASEWTNKPWKLETTGKETLHIPFNAKNYDTNKWEETDYAYVLTPCK